MLPATQWQLLVRKTVCLKREHYSISLFLECLKEKGCPLYGREEQGCCHDNSVCLSEVFCYLIPGTTTQNSKIFLPPLRVPFFISVSCSAVHPAFQELKLSSLCCIFLACSLLPWVKLIMYWETQQACTSSGHGVSRTFWNLSHGEFSPLGSIDPFSVWCCA